MIGPSITVSGRLTGDEDLTVRGRVEGELTLSKTLMLEPSGVVKANVTVKNAIISGVVVGNVTASESVELTREGRMVGDIRAPRVIIVEGASFRGRIDMGEAEPGRVATERPRMVTPPMRPTVRPAAAPPRPPPPPAPAPRATAAPTRPAPPPPPAARPAAPPPPAARPASRAPAPPPPPSRNEGKSPPAPPTVGAGAKKKVLFKKR